MIWLNNPEWFTKEFLCVKKNIDGSDICASTGGRKHTGSRHGQKAKWKEHAGMQGMQSRIIYVVTVVSEKPVESARKKHMQTCTDFEPLGVWQRVANNID